MFHLVILVLFCCTISISEGLIKKCCASHSGEFGGSGGTCFSHAINQLDGPITAISIQLDSSHITGLQVQYGKEWSEYVGGPSGELHMTVLRPGEAIDQVSGKADSYKLKFVTNLGRRFSFGADMGTSFSTLPLLPGASLSYISGRSSSVTDAIGFYWSVKPARGAAE